MSDRITRETAATDVVALAKGPPPDSLLAGKYRVEATLGFGGMGVVIAARHLQLDERVAIKVLRDDVVLDAEHVQRFIREAQAAVRLKSEHVARISDVGMLPDGKPYMVMELLEGLDLGRLLQDHGQLARPLAVDLVLQACDALAEAHAIGIVHRDIKPSNLFVTSRRDGSPLLKVLDFGISKAQSTAELSLTQTSSMLGTPAYMSPEQMRSARTADARSDLWSLGTVLYELVEGTTAFHAENFAELCVAVATEAPRPMTRAPELTQILARCLAKSPADRYPSIAELALALEPLSTDPQRARRQVHRIYRTLGKPLPWGRDATPTPIPVRGGTFAADEESTVFSPAPTFARHHTRRPWLLVLGLIALAAAAAAGVFVLTSSEDVRGSSSNAASGSSAPAATVPRASTIAGSATEPTPAASTSNAAGSATGSDHTVTQQAPPPPVPPTRPPPHHSAPHPATPPPQAGSAASYVAPPRPPRQPTCDPFAHPHGCPHKATGGHQEHP